MVSIKRLCNAHFIPKMILIILVFYYFVAVLQHLKISKQKKNNLNGHECIEAIKDKSESGSKLLNKIDTEQILPPDLSINLVARTPTKKSKTEKHDQGKSSKEKSIITQVEPDGKESQKKNHKPGVVSLKNAEKSHDKQKKGETGEQKKTGHPKNNAQNVDIIAVNNQNRKHQRMNVLFIMVDDLRTQIGAYQDAGSQFAKPRVITPNLDNLAKKSLLLKNAYIQFSLCGPSRASILTSRRPDTTEVYNNQNYWRTTAGNFTTIPQYFKENGYHTTGAGKIYHYGPLSDVDDPYSWSSTFSPVQYTDGFLHNHNIGTSWKKVTAEEQKKIKLMDKVALQDVQRYLQEFSAGNVNKVKPFFVALGINKPHMAYVCPKEYFELYKVESEPQFLPDKKWQNPSITKGTIIRNATWLDETHGWIPDKMLRELRRSYFACISYVDALIGELLHTLDELNLTKSTVISLVADHGYHMGENNHIGKVTVFDAATRVPMMIHVPGKTDRGIISDSPVEALDLFPTLADAAGLPSVPSCPGGRLGKVKLCTEGSSLLPLVDDPGKVIKEGALSQINLGPQYTYMHYSVRTKRYRYTERAVAKFIDGTGVVYRRLEPHNKLFYSELYDHDKDVHERFNLTGPGYDNIRRKLSNLLHGLRKNVMD